ncbi:dTMP kinase [Tropicimonas sediminicola]|uniref:Thymidylate kinase n=1 Tax=Tropicimonas sediminicola TaxID=1031541 RepID=A0A239KAM0_9RHOB|nr:dTMP kinase [Tropicimonas sediminicola]SNT15496.1 thymidylate kinase [Tropicimonas sediminicola]
MPAPEARRGVFITFEGIDGSGKSTQARRLYEALAARGHSVDLTREPGGSEGAEQIRSLVLEGDPDRWSAETEILLFTAARRDHLEKRIWPALDAGRIVICDRFADSTRLYQGLRGPGLRQQVDRLHEMMIGTEPDITFVIDLDPATGLSRAKGRQTAEERFEDFGEGLQRQMRDGFLDLARAHPERFIVIDGARSPDAVAADVLDRASARLPRPVAG